jgi:protein-S-isoprenylcysteine O-methyltransferase Ste14
VEKNSESSLILASTLPLIFILAAIAVLGVTGNLFSASPFVVAAQIAAIGLNVWARRSFQKGTFRVTAAPAGGSIIRSGPYRFIRHPMYSAALLFVWAAVMGHLSRFTLAVGVAVTGVGAARVIAEERLLRKQYPDYPDYARATKSLVPYLF